MLRLLRWKVNLKCRERVFQADKRDGDTMGSVFGGKKEIPVEQHND